MVCHGSDIKNINGMIMCMDCETVHYFRNGKLIWDFYPITREYLEYERNRKERNW